MTSRDTVDDTLRSIAYKATRSRPELFEDAFQEARLAAHTVTATRDAGPGLQVRAGRNAVLDLLRGRNHRLTIAQAREREPDSLDAFLAPTEDGDEPPHVAALAVDGHADDAVRRVAVAAAVGRLCAEDRELVRLRFWAGLTSDEAAAQLGISNNAARMRWRERVRPVLREALA